MRKGDDSNAFKGHLIRINRPRNTENLIITKCILQCGNIRKLKDNPEFPYFEDFTSEESKLLKVGENPAYLQIFDEEGLKVTCKGSINIPAEEQVVRDECEYSRG